MPAGRSGLPKTSPSTRGARKGSAALVATPEGAHTPVPAAPSGKSPGLWGARTRFHGSEPRPARRLPPATGLRERSRPEPTVSRPRGQLPSRTAEGRRSQEGSPAGSADPPTVDTAGGIRILGSRGGGAGRGSGWGRELATAPIATRRATLCRSGRSFGKLANARNPFERGIWVKSGRGRAGQGLCDGPRAGH